MSLIRLSIFALIILAIIPTSQSNHYSVSKILKNTSEDLGNFCVRTPETCNEAAKAASSIKDKAVYIKDAVVSAFSSSGLKTATIGQKSDRLDYAEGVEAENIKSGREPTRKLASEDIADEDYRASTRQDRFDIKRELEEGSPDNTLTNQDKALEKEDKAAQWLEPTSEQKTRVSSLWD